jgi:hypothetical protein
MPVQDQNDSTFKDLDEYIGTNVLLPGHDGIDVLCVVKGRKRDSLGNLIGESNQNPILDSRIFKVEYPDGHLEEYSTNVIAESLYANADDDGFSTGIFDTIIDYRSDDTAVKPEDGFVKTVSGQSRAVITTKGWDLHVQWKDGSSDWIPLSQIKESNPIDVAEFAISRNIHKLPAFRWWVTKALRKRDRIIKKMKSRIRKPRMKFGIEIPTTVAQALELDRRNGNTYWRDAIDKEFKNVNIAFKLLGDDDRVPIGYKEITCHLIFEVKFDLRRKARYVAGGHLTDPPASMTYCSVVSRESVRIAFLLAALNDLDILAGDIQNAYLNAPTKEKCWFRAGDEWGANAGKQVLIVRALYGLKSSGQQWRTFLADTLQNIMGFKSSLADPDMWYRASTRSDGSKYYSYLLVYVDDILIVDETPKKWMDLLETQFQVKPSSIGPPTVYLGSNIQKVDLRIPQHDRQCWGMSAEQYVTDSIKNLKKRLKEDGFEFNKKLSDVKYSPRNPFSNQKYRPELDTSTPCTDQQCEFFQNLIGVLRWIVELGRIDIHFEVAYLSQHLAYPRVGHLCQALHIFKYLDIHRENFLSFDPTRIQLPEPIDRRESAEEKRKTMKDFYPDAEEAKPPNAPAPRGKAVQINVFVDADHAGNVVTRKSHTGIITFLNMAPVSWYSKRQNTVESSTFSSEFVALRTTTEHIISLRYKLRMMGVPIDGPANVFCDNEAVYKNVSYADSTLKKKHNSIAYHRTREAVAAGTMIVWKEESGSNLADILTKSLPPEKRIYIIERIMLDEKVEAITKKE